MATTDQTVGDCQVAVCDGMGKTTTQADDKDVLDDQNECTDDVCSAAGAPENNPLASGTTCTDGGGAVCDGAGACVECVDAADCASGVCTMNKCIAASCTDAVKNDKETDVDCGGADCNPCATDKVCVAGTDCIDTICTAGLCAAPTCSDVAKNGVETDVDCGGGTCATCGPTLGCAVDGDCTGGSCSGMICLPTCTDTVKNAMETDVDCGGPTCTPCDDAKTCAVGSDCSSKVCTTGVCDAPTCTDGVQNGVETDVDCGGLCSPCGATQMCATAADCAAGVCTGGVCQAPLCTDLVKNGTETDVDCGGSCATKCATSQICLAAADCVSSVCTGGVCQAPVCGDSVINGAEACDDGNAVDGDGCSSACAVEAGHVCAGAPSVCSTVCGDGIVTGAELCDDGNLVDGDGCASTCTVQAGYSCAGAPSLCAAICGDNLIVGTETCDDGNVANGDCCSSACQIEAGCEIEPNDVCGTPNVIALTGSPATGSAIGSIKPIGDADYYSFTLTAPSSVRIETFIGGAGLCTAATNSSDAEFDLIAPDCATVLGGDDDDGPGLCPLIDPTVAADSFAKQLPANTYFVKMYKHSDTSLITQYQLQISLVSVCGNGTTEPTEQCDGGPTCAADCTLIPVCGDGLLSAGEGCDDGNVVDGDGCTSTCAPQVGYTCNAASPTVCTPICGDGLILGAEACDDGNTTAGDGCSATCTVTPGFTCVGAPSVCASVCGDAIAAGTEICDDGNTVNGDGCDSTCHIEGGANETEFNNTTAQADVNPVISGDAQYIASISTSGDKDIFRVDVATGTAFRFETFQTQYDCASLAMKMSLLSSAGVVLKTDASGTVASGIASCAAMVVYLDPGTYYVQVEKTSSGTIPKYFFQAKVLTDDGLETEPNEDSLTANAMPGVEMFIGGAYQDLASDWYSVTVPAGMSIRAETIEGDAIDTCEAFDVDTKLALFSPAAVSLVTDDDDGRGYCSAIDGTGATPRDSAAHNLAAGTYFLRVQGYSSSFNYRLAVTVR